MQNEIKININKKSRKQIIKKNLNIKTIVISVVILIFTFFVFIYLNILFTKYEKYEIISKEYITNQNITNEQISYFEFKNGIVRYSYDGVSFINSFFKTEWFVAYDFKNLIIDISEHYFVISNYSGNEIIVFNENGITGRNYTEYNIDRVKISDNGYLYVLLNDNYTSYINVYDNTLKKLDISIKSLLSGDGLATDIDVSNDGTELCVNYSYIDTNKLKTKVVYYNFGEIGKFSNPKRIVGIFENGDDFVGSINFFDNNNSQFICEDSINFVSTKILTSPKITNSYFFDNILSFTNSNDYFAIVISELGNKKLIIFDKTGKKLSTINIDIQYDDFYITKDIIVFINKNRIIGISTFGKIKFDIFFNDDIYYVHKKNSFFYNELIVATNNYIQNVILK